MRRGTRVGQAYIALTADGSGMNEDIVEALDSVDFADMGDRHGQDYEDNLVPHLDAIEKNMREAGRRMGDAFERDNAIGESIARSVAKGFQAGDFDGLIRELGDRTGVSFGGAFGDRFRDVLTGSALDSIQEFMEDAARSGNVEVENLYKSIGQDSTGAGGTEIPSRDLNQIAANALRIFEGRVREELRIDERAAQRSAEIYQNLLDGETSALERSLAEREQLEEDDARRSNRARLQYQAEFARLLEAQEAQQARDQNAREETYARLERERDDDRFRRFSEMAARMTSNIRLDPRIDSDQINASLRRLRADLEAADAIRLRLSADLPPRERDRIQAELEGIRARIRVSLDEDALNRSMLNAQGIVDRATRSGGSLDFGSRIGRLLGAGSRNNFLNIIGKSIGGLVKLFTGLGSIAGSTFRTFGQGFSQAGSSASLLTKLMGGFGAAGSAAFASIAASLPALLAGLALVALAMSILVSVASALLALLTAIVSTILSGLVGALAVLGGSLAAVVAGAGLLTIAFTSMTEAQQDFLSANFQPLKAQLTGLGQLMITQMIPYFATWASNLREALSLLTPAAQVLGDAFGRAGSILTASFSGPGFQAFASALTTYLPSIVTRLSTALGGFLNGLLGIFSVLLPYVNRFAGYLARVATDFSKWANSATGRNEIVDFVDRALDAFQDLYDFVQEFFGFLGDVLFSTEAQSAGGTIFDSFTRSFRGFRRAIEDGRLEKWFNDAIEFGKDLKDALASLSKVVDALYSSKVLQLVGDAIAFVARSLEATAKVASDVVNFFGNTLPNAVDTVIQPFLNAIDVVDRLQNSLLDLIGIQGAAKASITEFAGAAGSITALGDVAAAAAAAGGVGQGLQLAGGISGTGGGLTADQVTELGNSALNDTLESNGGYKPDPIKPAYVSPYAAWADQMLAENNNIKRDMEQAMKVITRDMTAALREASKAMNATDARAVLTSGVENALDAGQSMVEAAQSALDDATRTLGSTSSAAETERALKRWYKVQDLLDSALRRQDRIQKLAERLGDQKRVDPARVSNLVNGFRQSDATLAEYAAARSRIAAKLEQANERLVSALALRDQYKSQVVESVKAFGSLITAQARSIDGVEQALSAGDITANLQERLAKIRAFQANLRILLAQGLSKGAYKQLVDAGVEGGSAYAEALVAGGTGAVGQVNTLTAQIAAAAQGLGSAASERMYQAGVDAAQGLVDGLESLSEKLDNAATRLGNSIAKAIKRALGFEDPKGRVSNSANRLVDNLNITSSPGMTRGGSRGESAMVPGEGSRQIFRDLIVNTPTDNPKAVATEAINELTGRL